MNRKERGRKLERWNEEDWEAEDRKRKRKLKDGGERRG